MFVMIKENIAKFCVPVEIILGQWICLSHWSIGFKTLAHILTHGNVFSIYVSYIYFVYDTIDFVESVKILVSNLPMAD